MTSLSIVIPLRNEVATVRELALRCVAAARAAVGAAHELLFVDDASDDGTGAAIDALSRELRVRRVALPRRRGQFRATQAGLREARGDAVVVLDGDLQDPPELIPELLGALERSPRALAAYGVKLTREDPAWFLAGRAIFAGLLRAVGGHLAPAGSGSFVAMRRAVARQVAAVSAKDCNLAVVLAALGARGPSLGYHKAARVDGASRVGVLGLVREALGSLAVATAPRRRREAPPGE